LQKDPGKRLQHIDGARILIEEALTGETTASAVGLGGAVQPIQQRWAMAVGLVLLGAVVAGLVFWLLIQPSAPEQQLSRFIITPSRDARLANTNSNELAISPNGRHVIYRGVGDRGVQLYLRSLDDFVDRGIPGTEGAGIGNVFFSPDGKSIGFFADGALKKVSLSGGAPITLGEANPPGLNGNWGSEDTIVFSASGVLSEQPMILLYQIPASGGEREILATPNLDKDEGVYSAPQFLPGEEAVLFNVLSSVALRQTYNVDVSTAVLSLDTGEQEIILENSRNFTYMETGHLIYRQPDTANLMAVPFDLTNREVTGDSIRVLDGIRGANDFDYAISENGTLAYVPGGSRGGHDHSLVWVDRQGTETLMTQEKGEFANPRISPDGKQVAVNIRESSGQRYLWLYDVEDDSFSRLTFDGGGTPSWSPDGQWLIFQHGDLGEYGLARQPADRSRPMEKLTSGPNRQNTNSWSPDGQVVAFSENPRPSQDIGIYSLDGDGEPEYILTSPANECCARFSPDGKWLAYVSNELGQRHVYVRPYPKLDVQWLISDAEEGGDQPVWSPDGKELFYRSRDKMMVVSIQVKDQTLDTGKPRVLFEGAYASHSNPPGMQYYDISPDGQRFLMMKEEQRREAQGEIRVIQNWFEELKRLVPTN
jgi:serine/threonine-protein kinase